MRFWLSFVDMQGDRADNSASRQWETQILRASGLLAALHLDVERGLFLRFRCRTNPLLHIQVGSEWVSTLWNIFVSRPLPRESVCGSCVVGDRVGLG